MARILIVGGSRFIGRHIAGRLQDRGHYVVASSRLEVDLCGRLTDLLGQSGMTRPLVIAIAIMSAPGICRAQAVYTPNTPAQLPPMRVEVVNSTSFRDIETGSVYRLYGVDSCRPEQLATLGCQHWPCAAVATAWLVNATLGKWVSCNVLRGQDALRLARCSSSEHSDLAADMLKEGLAVTLPPDQNELIRAYGAAQEQAKKAYKGLWSSQFTMPWEASAPKPAQVSNE